MLIDDDSEKSHTKNIFKNICLVTGSIAAGMVLAKVFPQSGIVTVFLALVSVSSGIYAYYSDFINLLK